MKLADTVAETTVESALNELRKNTPLSTSIVGCYMMDLYCAWICDRRLEPPQRHQYTGPTESNCRAQARKDGWRIKNDRAVCPRCARTWKEQQ